MQPRKHRTRPRICIGPSRAHLTGSTTTRSLSARTVCAATSRCPSGDAASGQPRVLTDAAGYDVGPRWSMD
ncbi:MAG: hypothetical protein AAFX41_12270, partial [Bacteroidota bacterium]